MIHYNVCNDKGKYWTILWASENYYGRLNLVIPIVNLFGHLHSYTRISSDISLCDSG